VFTFRRQGLRINVGYNLPFLSRLGGRDRLCPAGCLPGDWQPLYQLTVSSPFRDDLGPSQGPGSWLARPSHPRRLLFTVRGVPVPGSTVIWQIRFPVSLPTMDQPRQRISGNSCHNQREQRVLCHPLGHGSLARVNVSLCLWVLFSCLSDGVLASLIPVTDYS
jgi:hypothetical protein